MFSERFHFEICRSNGRPTAAAVKQSSEGAIQGTIQRPSDGRSTDFGRRLSDGRKM